MTCTGASCPGDLLGLSSAGQLPQPPATAHSTLPGDSEALAHPHTPRQAEEDPQRASERRARFQRPQQLPESLL